MGFTLGLPNSDPFFSEERRVQAVTSVLQNTGIHIDSMKSYVSAKPQVSANANRTHKNLGMVIVGCTCETSRVRRAGAETSFKPPLADVSHASP